MLRPLYTQGKRPCYPLVRRLGGLQSLFEEEKSPCLCRNWSPFVKSIVIHSPDWTSSAHCYKHLENPLLTNLLWCYLLGMYYMELLQQCMHICLTVNHHNHCRRRRHHHPSSFSSFTRSFLMMGNTFCLKYKSLSVYHMLIKQSTTPLCDSGQFLKFSE